MMDRDQFIAQGEQTLARRSFEDARKHIIRVSSGTSGGNPVVHISTVTGHIPPSARLLLATGSMNLQLMITLYLQYVVEEDCEVLSLSESHVDDRLPSLLDDFEMETIKGTPSFLVRILEGATRKTFRSVKLVNISNEYLTEATESLIRSNLPNATILASYSSSETGNLGKSCPALRRNQYHPSPGVLFEIEAPDENDVGEVVATTPRLTRYKTGDAGRLIAAPCACGSLQTLELVGRINFDYVRLVGATLHRKEFDRVMGGLKAYVHDYRVSVREERRGADILGHISLDICPTALLREEENPEDCISREIARRLFLTPTRTLEQLIEASIFLPPSIRLMESLPLSNKGVKITLEK
jgi:phenylacetate-coenzyme A ligase PaaK-like adenylate-forming protein